VYRVTVSTDPGLVYLVMAGIYCLVAAMFLGLLLLLLREERRAGPLDAQEEGK
jgi:hypothetical protein